MAYHLRLQDFCYAARQSFDQPQLCLVANEAEFGVKLQNVSLIHLNKRTWEVFRKALIQTIGQSKFNWICHRYRNNIDFEKLESSGSPLLPKHVEMFCVGTSQVLCSDVERNSSKTLKDLTRASLRQKMQYAQLPEVSPYIDPRAVDGFPRGSDFLFHNALLLDRNKQIFFSDMEQLSFPAWLERFSKKIVQQELFPEQLIPVLGSDGKFDCYKVFEKIATGKGLVAYALQPAAKDSSLTPLIIFRATQFAFSMENSLDTLIDDCHLNLGEVGWRDSINRFEKLMKNPRFKEPNQKIKIAGYSLGGAHAQYFLEAYHDSVFSAVFYSDPGIDATIAERFAKKVEARETSLKIEIFRTAGDLCHYVGGKHLGCGVTNPNIKICLHEVEPLNKNLNPIDLHSYMHFDNNILSHKPVIIKSKNLSTHLDNSKRKSNSRWNERRRRSCGPSISSFLQTLKVIFNWISQAFGITILRNNNSA